MSKPYKSCPSCGSNLDHGETCNCTKEPDKAAQAAQETAQPTLKKPDEPTLVQGA